MQAAVVVFADDTRRDLARLDRDRLVDDALLVGVVTHFDVARNGKVLAERVPYEAVVGQDAAQVRVTVEHDQQRVIYQPVTIEPREITPRIVREENYADSEGFRKG